MITAAKPLSRAAAVTLTAALIGALAACHGTSGSTPSTSGGSTPPPAVKVVGTVVSTAPSANQARYALPDAVSAQWAGLGEGNGVEWVASGAGGKTATENRAVVSPADAAAFLEAMNTPAEPGPTRSALSGLDAVNSPASSPVWVFSPLLDTTGPLDFNELAFDESPSSVVKAAKKRGLPKLTGRAVTFVITPPAGEQKPLSKLQIGYQHTVWENIAKAAGAKKVTFIDGPAQDAGEGQATVVDVPQPGEVDERTEGKKKVCTLPTPALFVADQATLIDRAATKKALTRCVGTTTKATKIVVEGHTAGTPGTDNEFAKNLSTQRATEVAAVLREMKVPAGNIEKVVGYGASKPLVKPGSDKRNRAVVVTFSTTS